MHYIKRVDLHCNTNNAEHHTSEISVDQLIVRRGQAFTLTLHMTQAFNADCYPLNFVAVTGKCPSEERGTKSCFCVPDRAHRSLSIKAVWKAELGWNCSPHTGIVTLSITPPADAPIGEYNLSVTYRGYEMILTTLTVLFNPWCPEDWVFLRDERERQEYVMNDQGIVYMGSGDYISPLSWDFGQFEKDMVKICLKLLDINPKYLKDPADDVSARCNPIYISRVISAMVNCNDDRGILQGRWGDSYIGGVLPTHWTGSYAILKRWYNLDCHPVKYGQCWVFAAVMCSVMRLLGIPCRVVTNYHSAHDNNRNLVIDTYHADYGVREKASPDSVWNFHVWVEGWMTRPDLGGNCKYDGWQVLDPTPQEKSEGVYCCGPAPVVAILNGETHLKYDIPFIYAEVNADCIDWLVKADGSKVKIFSDTKRVGQNISTKAIGCNKRLNITDLYKHREGTDKERAIFRYAVDRLNPGHGHGHDDVHIIGGGSHGNSQTTVPQQLTLKFEQVCKPVNGKDVQLKLVLRSDCNVITPLSINVCVQAVRYNRSLSFNIQTELKDEILQPWKDLCIPIVVPFSTYHKHMLQCDSLKVTAVVTDKQKPECKYLAENDVVLLDPPMSITVPHMCRLNCEATGEVVFMNPLNVTLMDCTLTLTGSGLFGQELEYKIPNLRPNNRVRVQFCFNPYRIGEKNIIADFDCSHFRDIKSTCTINVI